MTEGMIITFADCWERVFCIGIHAYPSVILTCREFYDICKRPAVQQELCEVIKRRMNVPTIPKVRSWTFTTQLLAVPIHVYECIGTAYVYRTTMTRIMLSTFVSIRARIAAKMGMFVPSSLHIKMARIGNGSTEILANVTDRMLYDRPYLICNDINVAIIYTRSAVSLS